jgi:hypothetical protein
MRFFGLSTRIYNELKDLVLKNILCGKKEYVKNRKSNIENPPGRRNRVRKSQCRKAERVGMEDGAPEAGPNAIKR